MITQLAVPLKFSAEEINQPLNRAGFRKGEERVGRGRDRKERGRGCQLIGKRGFLTPIWSHTGGF